MTEQMGQRAEYMLRGPKDVCLFEGCRRGMAWELSSQETMATLRQVSGMYGVLQYIPGLDCWLVPMVRMGASAEDAEVWMQLPRHGLICHERNHLWMMEQGRVEQVSAADCVARQLERLVGVNPQWESLRDPDLRLLLYERMIHDLGLLSFITGKLPKDDGITDPEELDIVRRESVWWEAILMTMGDGTELTVSADGPVAHHQLNKSTTYLFSCDGETYQGYTREIEVTAGGYSGRA